MPEWEEKENGTKKELGKNSWNFHKFVEIIHLPIQEAQQIQTKINTRLSLVQLPKTKLNKLHWKPSEKNITYRRTMIYNALHYWNDILWEAMDTRKL